GSTARHPRSPRSRNRANFRRWPRWRGGAGAVRRSGSRRRLPARSLRVQRRSQVRGVLAARQAPAQAPAAGLVGELQVPVVAGVGRVFGGPAELVRLQGEDLIRVLAVQVQQGQRQRLAATELATGREHPQPAVLRLQYRTQLQLRGTFVGAEVGDLDLAGALHLVGNRIDAAAARGCNHQPDARDHRGQRQGDHQPDHGFAQGVALVAFFVHRLYIGPKKVLSTVSLLAPSSLRIVNTTSWRPWIDAGALSTTGSERTSSACAW